jgi:hypothetical protein
LNKLAFGRPIANLGSMVMGITPLAVPISTAVLVCPNINKIV